MGVIMQAFYWDCPKAENCEYHWWEFLQNKIPELSAAGFTALWIPPVNKAASSTSMGYDPYDYYDLGAYDQRGAISTWFGSKQTLVDLITEAHEHRMQVYADLVLNHNSGADETEVNPEDGQERWTKFTPKSGKFLRDWTCFHPSLYESFDGYVFEGMPDLCHRNPLVYTEMIEYARWLLEEIKIDGFRYDCVKGYGAWMVRSIQELRGLNFNQPYRPFGVGECWDSQREITDWLSEANSWSDNPVAAFDFNLRYRLKDLCMNPGFSLKQLVQPGTLINDGRVTEAVTFVENHDVVREDSIINDKMLAYAFILTHEGYPCVFWQDYFNWHLAETGKASGIARLVEVHEKYAGGDTSVLYVDDDLYIMQRNGHGSQQGLIFVLNNSPWWEGKWVATKWNNTKFVPVAWRGKYSIDTPDVKFSNDDGWGDFFAPARGYVVYVPVEL